MADIFLSYSRADKPRVAPLVAALEGLGWSVWWDMDLAPGVDFDSVTAAALDDVRAVVVVWTQTSVASRWVRGEARVGAYRGVLVPVRFDGAQLPIDVRAIHTTDMDGWNDDPASPPFQKLVQSLKALLGGASLAVNKAASLSTRPAPAPTAPMLAVLPFDNLSGDPEMAFFSDGVSDEIIQAVSRALRTIGRASSFQFRGADKAVRKVAAELGATHVLDGAVRKGAGMVRISAQLIDAGSQLTVWQGQYDRPTRDLFAVQDEIAIAVAHALHCKLSPRPQANEIDPETYEAYLRLAKKFGDGSAEQRSQIALADEITRRAPTFGQGWMLAAQTRAAVKRNLAAGPEDRRKLQDEIRDATARATQLLGADDPGLTSIVVNWTPWTGAWTECENRLRGALVRTPHSLSLMLVLGSLTMHAGRSSEAAALFSDVAARDPLQPMVGAAVGMAHCAAERHDEGFVHLENACRRWPKFWFARHFLLNAAAIEARWDIVDRWTTPEVVARSRNELGRGNDVMATVEMHRDPADPRRGLAMRRLEERAAKDGRVKMSEIAEASQFGDISAIHDAVEGVSFAHLIDPMEGHEPGDLGVQALFTTPARRLRADPRFVRLCARLGLTAHWIETGRWPDCAEHVPYDFRTEARREAGTPLG